MPCKRVFLSIGALFGNLKAIHLPELFEGKAYHKGVPLLDPEDIEILGNVVPRRKPQSTFCVNVRPWLHSYIYIYIQGVTGGTDQTSGECSLC